MSTDGLFQPVPRPVPELASTAVSDDDRNRYGVLLDHAAERGLLSPTEYRETTGQLAEAPSIEDLQRIVTELPAFDLSGAPAAITETTGRPGAPGRVRPPRSGRSRLGAVGEPDAGVIAGAHPTTSG